MNLVMDKINKEYKSVDMDDIRSFNKTSVKPSKEMFSRFGLYAYINIFIVLKFPLELIEFRDLFSNQLFYPF
jgi:hypothetical protein